MKCSKLTSRVFNMGPDLDWFTKENLLNMKYFYRDHLSLITEGYKKLAKTINLLLMNTYPYTHDHAKECYYRSSVKLICEASWCGTYLKSPASYVGALHISTHSRIL